MRTLARVITALCFCFTACHVSSAVAAKAGAVAPLPPASAVPGTPTLGTADYPMTVRVLPQETSEGERVAQERERAEKATLDARLVTYTAALAIFTAILALSTIALWWVTKGLRDFAAKQANDMKASIAVAKSSADAAQMAAHAAVAADLPILVVESVTCGPRATQATVRVGKAVLQRS